jgi:hypothetical protein
LGFCNVFFFVFEVEVFFTAILLKNEDCIARPTTRHKKRRGLVLTVAEGLLHPDYE